MRTWARIAVVLGLIGPVAMGCASIAGIEDLSLTGSPDASDESSSGDATMDTSGSSSGASGSSSGSGGDAKSDTSSPVDAGSCSPGQIRCSGNGVQTCGGNGMWAAPQACVDQTCLAGACVGMCAPGQTHPVPCGNCGMDTQTCTSSGTWQSSGNCSGQGACVPSSTQGCDTYGTQTCTASCAWGACSCPSAPACTPQTAQCSGNGVETCGACGQYGNPVACTSGTCVGGMCAGTCSMGQKQCSGNSAQTCVSGMWQTTSACPNQTCISGTCSGVCAPGQTNPVSCGNCGTDTETCDSTGNWKSSGSCNGQGVCTPQATMQCNMYGTETCSSSCAWGACSCTSTPVCTPGAHQCSGNGVQTCSQCGQWGNPVSCGTGMTCTGGGTCTNTGTDCPGSFLLCDGFESGSIDTTTKWQSPNCSALTSMSVGSVAHSGSHSLHVAMQQVTDTSYVSCNLKTQQTSIFSSTPMYFRAWIYFQNFIPGTANTIIITTPSSANGQSASGGMGIDAVGDFIAGQSNSGADYEKTSTTQAIFPGMWTCIELGINTNYSTYPNGLLQAWDTTTGGPDLSGNANLQSLTAAEFGLTYNGPAAPTDLYIDDIAISSTYIGCNQ